MLWDLIRDFFVQHIFGGFDSLGESYSGRIGMFYDNQGYEYGSLGTDEAMLKLNLFPPEFYEGDYMYMTFGDWLSTTATIISISIIVVFCCLFIYKIIKLIGGLIR